MFESFHFLNPQWLLALLPLSLVYLWLLRSKSSDSDWDKVIDRHLLPVLLQKAGKATRSGAGRWLSWLLMLGWFIAVLALADPVWQKRVIPVVQTKASRVIVLDLSRSMNIADIKPSRLARAKFVVEDILAQASEGQTALVAFAGDAFTVTPLTRDVDTIRSLLPALSPDLMPVQGSRADRGLLKAQELLQQAGVPRGQVLLIADGAQAGSAIKAASKLSQHGYRVSVLGVGTKQGGPLPGVRDDQGKPVIVPLQESVLQEIARAGKGHYRHLSGTRRVNIADLLAADNPVGAVGAEAADTTGLQRQDWKSQGPLLVLILLPLAALAFRRGWLLSMALCALVLGQPEPAQASVWDDLWLRKDQQADKALRGGDYKQAEQLANDPLRRGSAAYKKGDFQQALEDFKAAKGADAAYNRGNALAALKQYKEAIKAYDEALKLQPDMQDAKHNKAKVMELLKKQQQQKKKQEQKQQQQKDQQQQVQQDKNQQGQQDKQQQNQQQQGQQQAKNDQQQGEGNQQQNQEKQQGQQAQQQKEGQQEGQQKEGQQKDEKNAFAKANEKLKKDQQEQGQEKQKDKQQQAAQAQQQAEEKAEQEKQAAAQAQRQEQQVQQKKQDAADKQNQQAAIEAEQLNSEEKMAAEQWLRRIPDNPGELLKRKFKYQYQQRGGHVDSGAW